MWPFKKPSEFEQICRLKKKCRKLRVEYMEGYGHYDCGHHMAQLMNPTLGRIARKHDEAYAKLRKLDPDAPEAVPLSR